MSDTELSEQRIQSEVKRRVVEDTALASRDDSQFATYLDAPRFHQLLKVAEMFANSQLVPDHFKGKKADCMIVCQMAMRMGVDPWMLLQKTYVIGGKPAMEAQIPIALVNSSGLYKTNIRYEMSGEGDERGCVAWVIDKDGQKLEGPRVSIATAKAEGWYNRNGSKWKTIPDLMMRYRAAAWFARLYCPERLMGMLTDDEARDIGETTVQQETPRGLTALKAAVAAKVTPAPQEPNNPAPIMPHPGDDAQTIDTGSAQDVPKEEVQYQQDARHIEQSIKLPWAEFVDALIGIAPQDAWSSPEALRSAIGRKVVALQRKGKEESISPDMRRKLYVAVASDRFSEDGKIEE